MSPKEEAMEDQCLSSSSSSSCWSLLPSDLQKSILGRLPMVDFFRLRQVCTAWRSLLSSPSFLTSLPPHPCLVMSPPQYGRNYMNLLDLMSARSFPLPHSVDLPFLYMFPSDRASAAGLLAVKVGKVHQHHGTHMCSSANSMLLLNPLNGHSVKIAIPENVQEFDYFALLADPADKTYTIYFVHEKGMLCSYSSKSCSWESLPPSPSNVRPRSFAADTRHLFLLVESENCILVYKMEQSIWCTVQFNSCTLPKRDPILGVAYHTLLLYKGELLLASIWPDDIPNMDRIGIWKLQYDEGNNNHVDSNSNTTAEWIQKATKPIRRANRNIRIFGKFMLMENLICLIPYFDFGRDVILYDLVYGKWQSYSLQDTDLCVAIIDPLLTFDL